MLALHTGRPVKMIYDRNESFLGHVHRHPAKIWYRHHANKDGLRRRWKERLFLTEEPMLRLRQPYWPMRAVSRLGLTRWITL